MNKFGLGINAADPIQVQRVQRGLVTPYPGFWSMFLGIGTIEFIEDVGKGSSGFIDIHQPVTDLVKVDLPGVEFATGIEFIEDRNHYLLPVPIVVDMKSLDGEREAI